MSEIRTVRVRQGRVEPSGSWVYVWVDVQRREVAYVGGTGYEPELRAHLHLSETAELAHVRADVPDAVHRDFDVLAYAVPLGVPRAAVKAALIEELQRVPDAVADRDGLGALVARAIEQVRDRG